MLLSLYFLQFSLQTKEWNKFKRMEDYGINSAFNKIQN